MKKFAGDKFDAESAGLEPGTLNPYVVEVLKEDGIDISKNTTKDVFDFCKAGKMFSYVITVCDVDSAERCPIFPGVLRKISWNFSDPSQFSGNSEEILQQTRLVRDNIKEAVLDFINEINSN